MTAEELAVTLAAEEYGQKGIIALVHAGVILAPPQWGWTSGR
jgi:hypothetical protein